MPLPARLLCALLTLLLALPAVQVNACAPAADAGRSMGHDGAAHAQHDPMRHGQMTHDQMAHGQMEHGGPSGHDGNGKAPAGPQTHHDCIGCLAPLDTGVYRPVARLDFSQSNADALPPSPHRPGQSGAPEPPPPRILI